MAEQKQNTEILVLESIIEKYIFAKPFRGDEAREVYKEVKKRVKKDFKNASVFDVYFQFNEETREINGSTTAHGILINDVLTERGLRLPTITEAKKLDVSGRLSNGVYRDYGIAVYSENEPNKEIARELIKEANKRKWQLPILASFKDLELIKTGTEITFKKDAEGVITGEKARQYLNEQFNYTGNSGACGLDRSGCGCWNAGWCYLAYSGAAGRVDWMCGEATPKNLESAVLMDIGSIAKKEVEKLNDKISSAKESAIKVLRG